MSSLDALQKLTKIFFENKSLFPVGLSTILTGILSRAEYLMEKESQCPCDAKLNVRYACISFIFPASALFLLSLLVLPDARKIVTCRVSICTANICRWKTCENGRNYDECSNECSPDNCRRKRCNSCCGSCCCLMSALHFFLSTLLKISIPSILWVVILFADGDYYACANLNETFRGQDFQESCASKSGVLPYERRKLCVHSQMTGGILLVITLLVLVVFHFLPGCFCSEETQEEKAEGIEMITYTFQQQQSQSTDIE